MPSEDPVRPYAQSMIKSFYLCGVSISCESDINKFFWHFKYTAVSFLYSTVSEGPPLMPMVMWKTPTIFKLYCDFVDHLM